MKLLLLILLNVAVVVVAFVIYDIVRDDEPMRAAEPEPSATWGEAIADLEARTAALEARPIPLAKAPDAEILRRLSELERRKAADSGDTAPPAATATEEEGAEAAKTADGEPTPEDIESFRKLAKAAQREERARSSGRRVARAAENLGLALTDDQKVRLAGALADFEPRRNEIWGEAKRAGAEQGDAVDWSRIIEDTNERIRREFADRIAEFIPRSDAALLSEALQAGK